MGDVQCEVDQRINISHRKKYTCHAMLQDLRLKRILLYKWIWMAFVKTKINLRVSHE